MREGTRVFRERGGGLHFPHLLQDLRVPVLDAEDMPPLRLAAQDHLPKQAQLRADHHMHQLQPLHVLLPVPPAGLPGALLQGEELLPHGI